MSGIWDGWMGMKWGVVIEEKQAETLVVMEMFCVLMGLENTQPRDKTVQNSGHVLKGRDRSPRERGGLSCAGPSSDTALWLC